MHEPAMSYMTSMHVVTGGNTDEAVKYILSHQDRSALD
jgi:hypothetical protein